MVIGVSFDEIRMLSFFFPSLSLSPEHDSIVLSHFLLFAGKGEKFSQLHVILL